MVHADHKIDLRTSVVPFPPELVARYRALDLWADTTIGEAFTAVAATCPDRAAVIDPVRQLTYRELDQRSDAVATGMLELGLVPGDRIILQLTNRVETVEAWYGSLKAGVVPVCSLPIHGRRDIESLIRTTGARAHLVDAEVRDGALLELALDVRTRFSELDFLITVGDDTGSADATLAILASGLSSASALGAAHERFGPDDLAILQLSGGTTAAPKAIPRLHAESWYNGLATAHRYPILAAERVAHVIPLIHNAGVHSALHAGHSVGATVLTCSADPDEFIPFLREQKADSVLLVPGMVSWLLEREDFRSLLTSLRRFSMSAAAVPPELFDELDRMGVACVQQFGMGEGLCTGMSLDDSRAMRRDTVGYVLSEEDEARIVGPDGEDVPLGEPGELWVRGPYTIRGYWHDPERNAVAFSSDGFYKTGDVMTAQEIDGRRCLVVGGRIKDLINRGGEKINAEEVEEAIGRHPDVREAALVAMPDRKFGERGCAYVVPRQPLSPPSLAELTEFLQSLGLAKYKWPERVEIIERLPRTQVGKVEKAGLRELIARKLEEEGDGAGS
jgi:2,3-dihydroxybenzoate-AMP ligase